MWARFSEQEMARRWSLARDLMRRIELGGLLFYGSSGTNRHDQANIFWLTNHLDLHHNYLVAPLDDSTEPALYVGLLNHVPNAREVAQVPIVEWGGYNPAQKIAERLREIGLQKGRLGVVGVKAKFGIGMPYQHYLELRKALPDLELVDVTGEFSRLREVKSEEEIAWLRKAAEITDVAITTLYERIRPGMAEYELVGIIHGAVWAQGGLPHITFLRSMPMDAPSGCVPAQNPSNRSIERGDVIITEISASFWGYTGQIHRPFFVGTDPTPEWQRMFDVALEAYRRITQTIKPGATERSVIRAGSVIGENGYAIYDDLIHGYGVDILPPLIDRSCCQYWPWDEDRSVPEGRVFERNMAIVVQPNPITPDERMGLQLGALTVVTEQGAVALHRVPFDPLIVRI
ncbi:MAG: Xaa-Pro peptidase family protein [Armatimonadota bacterium]|nr:Xaa-Pro peptidase family protein [Armatimonadota bacterium]MDR5702913.1 Xaa-Pro peptidase family protein [Armatimonadota bacterium]